MMNQLAQVKSIRGVNCSMKATSFFKRLRATSILFLMAVVLMLAACSSNVVSPYPHSDVITGVSFDWSTHVQLAPGSDNWATTWGADDNQYVTFGDGGGFGGANQVGRVSLGFARIEGAKSDYVGVNVWGGLNPESPAQFDGKSYGIVSIGDTLYMWRCGEGSNDTAYAFQQLYVSEDSSATWQSTAAQFDESSFPDSKGFFCPTFLQFGKGYESARDEFVYMYAPEIKTGDWEVHKPGEIALFRAPQSALSEQDRYEYFAGTSPDGLPVWSADITERSAVFNDVDNGVMRTSVNFNEGLQKYFLITEHTKRSGSDGGGNIGIFEASEPWGPWRSVLFEKGWAPHLGGKGSFFWVFSNKWASADGKQFVMIFNTNDQWNTVEGQFEVSINSP